MNREASAPRPKRGARVIGRAASTIEAAQVEWLWPGRLPLGELTILAGDPGLGKSLLTIALTAKATRGDLGLRPSRVIMLTAEDSLEHTVVPRLRAAGADLTLVTFGSAEEDGLETSLLLPDHVGQLHGLIEETTAEVVIIDPLMAHLAGSVNSWKDQEVRRALAPLSAVAKETGAAVLVVAHLNKGQSSDPLQRLGGSVGIPAAARSVLLLARDPDDPDAAHGSRRVLAHVKSNLSPLSASLAFEIETQPLELDGFTRVQIARIVERGSSTYTGQELLAATHGEPGSKLAQAMAFLKSALTHGERPVNAVYAEAQKEGIAPQTLKRAKEKLGIEPRKLSFNQGWAWQLPDTDPNSDADEDELAA